MLKSFAELVVFWPLLHHMHMLGDAEEGDKQQAALRYPPLHRCTAFMSPVHGKEAIEQWENQA